MQLGTEFVINASNVPSQILLDLPFTLTFNILVSAQRCLQFYRFVALEDFSLNMLYFVMAFFWNGRYDRARGVEIGNKDIKLEHLEEAFTTSNWIVRIYKVKPPNNRW